MQEKLKEQLSKIKLKITEINSKYTKKTKIIAALILIAVIIFAFVLTAVLNNKSYATLYTGLNEQEASEITTMLQSDGVPFKYQNGTITVPEEQADKLKASLAMQGIPKSGLTYDVFKDNVDLMSTDFEKNSFKIYDLETRLASTIRMFDGVKSAVVTIAIGNDKNSYVKQNDKVDSTASVMVIMESGGSPDKDQVKGIQTLVARSVPGMKVDDVTVVDGEGRTVSASGDTTQETASQLKLQVEREIEDSTKAKILNLLDKMYGEDNVRVTVKTSVDIDKKISEIINYTPSTDDNKGVINKEKTGQEVITDGGQAGGIPGAETNANAPVYSNITADGNQVYYNNTRDYDYLVNQVKQQIQSDAGNQTDMTVSIALNTKDLSAAKTNQLKSLVANAAGIDPAVADQKIAIFNTPFYDEETTPATWNGILDFLQNSTYGKFIIIGLVVLLALLILIGVLMAKRRKRKLLEEEMLLQEAQLPLEDEILDLNMEDIKPSREKELRDKIKEFSDLNPEISAQLIKSWLRGGDESGN